MSNLLYFFCYFSLHVELYQRIHFKKRVFLLTVFFFHIAFNKMVSKHYFSNQSQTSQLTFTFLHAIIILLRCLLCISLTYPLPSFYNRNLCLPASPVSFTAESVLVNGYLHHHDTIYKQCIVSEFISSKVCSEVTV